jgi:hypothetical protein
MKFCRPCYSYPKSSPSGIVQLFFSEKKLGKKLGGKKKKYSICGGKSRRFLGRGNFVINSSLK